MRSVAPPPVPCYNDLNPQYPIPIIYPILLMTAATSIAPADTSPSARAETTFELPTRRWLDILLLGFILVNLAMALEAAHWSPGLDRLLPVTLMAVLAASFVAFSSFGPGFTFFYSLITGAAAILYGLSSLATGVAAPQEKVYQIIQRTFAWLQQVLAGKPGTDTVVFVLLLAILLWILSFNAVWVYVREKRKWQAVIPTGLAMLVNLYYAPVNLKAYFILYLAASMLLLVRATLAELEEHWYRERVLFPFDMGFDVMRDAVLFIVIVILISWVLPSALWGEDQNLGNPLENPWQQVKDEWNRLFNSLDYGETRAPAAEVVVFTPSHPLGGARELTDAPVMDVKTSLNRYFQATVLDTYTSNAWELRNTANINLTNVRVKTPQFSARRLITQTVTMRQYTNILMAAPMPVGIDIPATARLIPQDLMPKEVPLATEIGVAELAMILSEDVLKPGDVYTITSSVSFATESQLRHDSTVYPPEIQARYLQLPDTVPQRVFDLAEKLAQGHDNPYDIAKAIETYVRTYAYDEQIPGPAAGQDAADYFLFEEKRGYCDYYATSMAVMLRHLGIPTRLAQGYATGEYDPLSGSYRLREKDAHVWVEVYFPTYGWIQFEPTASEPVIERLQEAVEPPEAGGRASQFGQRPEEENPRNIPQPKETSPKASVRIEQSLAERWIPRLGWAFLILAGLGIAWGVGYGIRSWRRPARGARGEAQIKESAPDVLDGMWGRLLWWARRLGIPHRPSFTPWEQAGAFAQALPRTAEDVQTLARLYGRDKYAGRPLSSQEANLARQVWKRLRRQLWQAWWHQHTHFHLWDQITFWQQAPRRR